MLADDTADTLHARIQVQEHRLLPRVIHQIAIGAISLDPLAVHTPVIGPDSVAVRAGRVDRAD